LTKFELEGPQRFWYHLRMEIGQKLHELRTAKSFSQGDIEKRTGMLRCYVSRVENGHTVPNLETLRKWAAALDVEMYQLFFEGEGKPQAASQRQASGLGSEEHNLVESYTRLDKKDRRFLVALARKMANESKAAKRST
jgi:transcriptional regulator with XRE-family HTH domain